MKNLSRTIGAAVIALYAVAFAHPALAQTVQMQGAVSPDALKLPTFGDLPSAQSLPLRISFKPRNQDRLDALLAAQQDPKSPQYHKWLTPGEYSQRFGITQDQFDRLSRWLTSQGFRITGGSPAEGFIAFDGSVLTIGRAFNVRLSKFDAAGSKFGNLDEPMIPAEFSSTIGNIQGLNNLERAVPLHQKIGPEPSKDKSSSREPRDLDPNAVTSRFALNSKAQVAVPQDREVGLGTHFAPSDFYTFYDETGASTRGGGTGNDCIAIYAQSDTFNDIVGAFDAKFGLPATNLSRVAVDNKTAGHYNGAETETLLDIQWAHAVAPAAPISLYLAQDIGAAVQRVINDNQCGTVNISFGLCGAPSVTVSSLNSIFGQAASQGISIFISSGDQGAADLVFGCAVGTSRNVNEMSASPNVTSVGGTGANPNFDSSGNNVGFTAEFAWNDRSGATGGGTSVFFLRPGFQSAIAGTMRSVPDVAMMASPGSPGAFVFDDGNCISGSGCGSNNPKLNVLGGTSLAAPIWSGISKLIVDQTHSRIGNMDNLIYSLAGANQAGNGFRDVTSGNNTFNNVPGFTAVPGYDQVTGWGTVDVDTFVNSYAAAAGGSPTPTPTATPTPTVPARIKVSAAKVNFGKVKVGADKSKTVKVTNTAKKKDGATVNFSGVSLSGSSQFSLTTTCNGPVPPKGQCSITVGFHADTIGVANAAVTVKSNASNPAGFPVTATVAAKR